MKNGEKTRKQEFAKDKLKNRKKGLDLIETLC